MYNTPNMSALKKQNVLIVDDHPFIIEGYKNAITRYNPDEFEFKFTQAKDCETAYHKIMSPDCPVFDIAFLDISMPAYEEKGIFSGADLAKLILIKMPKCQIVLLTMYTELLKIKTIISSINPQGLVIKNDLTFDELLIAFNEIITGGTYYSDSVIKILNQSQHSDIELDQFDREILFHLLKGTPALDFPQYIPISLSAIDRRKEDLKKLLGVESGLDSDLVKEAKSRGFL